MHDRSTLNFRHFHKLRLVQTICRAFRNGKVSEADLDLCLLTSLNHRVSLVDLSNLSRFILKLRSIAGFFPLLILFLGSVLVV